MVELSLLFVTVAGLKTMQMCVEPLSSAYMRVCVSTQRRAHRNTSSSKKSVATRKAFIHGTLEGTKFKLGQCESASEKKSL